MTLTDSRIAQNQTDGSGGGIFNEDAATLDLFGSEITNNTAGVDGGGILNQGLID